MITKNLTQLAKGDVIVDPQGREHTVVSPAVPVHREADEFEEADDGFALTVSYVSEVNGGSVFTETREIFPVDGPETVLFTIIN